MKERLFEIIKRNELTAWRFAELLEVQPSSISHILSGRNKPSFDFIEKILTRFPEINPDWLILGQGEMVRDGYNDDFSLREVEEKEEPTLFDIEIDNHDDSDTVTNVNTTEDEIIDKVDGNMITNVIPSKHAISQPENDINSHITTNMLTDKVERVIIFYKDGTFNTYTPR